MLIFASGIALPLYVILLILMPAEKSIDVQTDYADLDFQKEIKITEEDIDKAQEFNAVDGRSHPQGPIVFAGILILIGVYLLAQNFGFLSFLNIGWFGPLLIIGFGLYVIYRRK
jgi:hypothetical protein